MSFTIFYNEKAPFQTIKTRSSQGKKIDVFPKGLSHVFGPKMAFFPSFFKAIQARKMCVAIFQKKQNNFLGYKHKEFKNSKKFRFFQRVNQWLLSKNGYFSTSFDAIQARKMYEKPHFQAKKTRSSKSQRMDIFPKELTYGFVPKMAIFLNFFRGRAIQARKMSFTIFQNKKTPFQAIKTRTSKTQKIDIFPQGLAHGFRPKMAIFPTFLRRGGIIQAKKMSFTIFQNEKSNLQAIKTRSSKSRKIHVFPKGLKHGFPPKMAIFQDNFFLGNKGQEKIV